MNPNDARRLLAGMFDSREHLTCFITETEALQAFVEQRTEGAREGSAELELRDAMKDAVQILEALATALGEAVDAAAAVLFLGKLEAAIAADYPDPEEEEEDAEHGATDPLLAAFAADVAARPAPLRRRAKPKRFLAAKMAEMLERQRATLPQDARSDTPEGNSTLDKEGS